MNCPRCKGQIANGECLTCDFKLGGPRLPVKSSMDWPPLANLNGEHHTHPILDGEGLSEGDD